MTHTQDFEHVLDRENVVGVDYDGDDDRVIAFVTEKKDEADLEDDDIVANNVDRDSDVVEIGEVVALGEMPAAQGDRHDRHRPVEGGVSEINVNSSAATAGPYPAKVVDTSKGEWGPEVEEGDLVRLSNNHVYARVDRAAWNEPIIQPSPNDGGREVTDRVGGLVGRVPIEDGVTVDLAARSVDPEQESARYHDLPADYPSGIRRDDYDSLMGAATVKTGRTTGVTEGEIKGTSATIRVGYGGDKGAIKLRDQIVTTDMSKGGDSGSPVFLTDTKEMVGELYAGSDSASIVYKASNMEEELGVELMTETDGGDGGSDKSFHRSLDTVVDIPMAEPDLDIEDISGDEPHPGETVDLDVTVVGSAPGAAWLEAQGKRKEFTLDEDGRRTVTFPITAPGQYAETFEVNFVGGYVL